VNVARDAKFDNKDYLEQTESINTTADNRGLAFS